jgi:asparagine synthase (glutamine-hydrolysing)
VANRLAPRVGPLASALRPLIERIPQSSGSRRLEDRVKRFARGADLDPLEAHVAWTEVFSSDARADLMGRRVDGLADPLDAYRTRFAETEGADPQIRYQDVDLGTYLVDDILVKTDRVSMAHSLEARVPILDASVADFALSLRSDHHVRRLEKKRLLRRAAEPLVPPEILSARKRGFAIPAAAWLRGELQPFAREVLSPERVREQGYFEPRVVTSLLDEHVAGRQDWSRQLWGLVSFSLWFDRYARVGALAA